MAKARTNTLMRRPERVLLVTLSLFLGGLPLEPALTELLLFAGLSVTACLTSWGAYLVLSQAQKQLSQLPVHDPRATEPSP